LVKDSRSLFEAKALPPPAEVSAKRVFCVPSCVFAQEGTLFVMEVKQDA